MTTIASTLGATDGISPASSSATGPVDNASSTNSQVLARPTAQTKKARKVLYFLYMYTRPNILITGSKPLASEDACHVKGLGAFDLRVCNSRC